MLCFSCPVRWHGIALSNLLTGTAWRCISAVSKLVTTKLVSQVEWRIGVDTACAGCRRVEQRVAVKSTHTCEQRQLVTAVVTKVEQQVQWWGTACYSQQEEMGKHEERAYLIIHVRLSPCMTIYQRKSLCKYTPSAPVYPCNNNLSGKTETAADCLVYHCCHLSCLPPSVSYLD